MQKFDISTDARETIIDITRIVESYVENQGISEGILFVHIPHTTAGITINENADPDVKHDILEGLKIFDHGEFRHGEGNSPAHIKSSLLGCTAQIKVEEGRLLLGTWQGIMFCEFDGPRDRQIWIYSN